MDTITRSRRALLLLAAGPLLAGCADATTTARATPPATQSTEATTPAPPPTTPTVSTTPASTLTGVTVGIDPGHNRLNHTRPDIIAKRIPNGRGDDTEACNTTGTSTNDGYYESTFTFAVASFLKADLEAVGAKVVMTRTDDDGVGPCVNERARIINESGARVAIDIHGDGGPATGRGFAILQPVPSGTNDAVVPASLRYAQLLRTEMLKTGMPTSTYDGKNGLTTRSDLGGLNLTTVPQLLLEVGNMRNATDAALMRSPAFQQQVAAAIVRAMEAFAATS